MEIKIRSWTGRFGNNIKQISNACSYAKENGCFFRSPEHNFVKSFIINPYINDHTNCFSDNFFYGYKQYNETRHDTIKQLIKPNLQKIETKPPLDSHTLVIHIRSGDVFSDNPNKKYLQNPLEYFVYVLNQFTRTIVVCEDYNNPVIEHLEKIDSVEIRMNNLSDDIATILSAKNLCFSGVGTFGPICAMLSDNIENIFMTNISNIDNEWIFNKNINIHNTHINMEKYIQFNTWNNSDEQRSLMINYRM